MMKHAALVLNGLALGLLGWVGYGLVQLVGARLPQPRVPGVELTPLSAAAQAEQAQVSAALDAMQRVAAIDPQRRMLVDAELVARPRPGTPQVQGSVELPQRVLTVQLHELDTQRVLAVVDGVLVRPGLHLQGGGRVQQVQPSSVVVRERQGQQALRLQWDRLRVGTLVWEDGSPASVATQSFHRQTLSSDGLQGFTLKVGQP